MSEANSYALVSGSKQRPKGPKVGMDKKLRRMAKRMMGGR